MGPLKNKLIKQRDTDYGSGIDKVVVVLVAVADARGIANIQGSYDPLGIHQNS